MSRDLRARALAYLRSGAVTVLDANRAPGPRRADYVAADVQGYRTTHHVSHTTSRGWWCTCPEWATSPQPCPHAAAVALVTGHPTPIRPEHAPGRHGVPLPAEPTNA